MPYIATVSTVANRRFFGSVMILIPLGLRSRIIVFGQLFSFYTTPPTVFMKLTSFIISMIISRGRMPENNLDVYLQPLIKMLKKLWTVGVDVYDSFKPEIFKLHAVLIWTTSDFPRLGTLFWVEHIHQTCLPVL